MDQYSFWTATERALLREHYPSLGAKGMRAAGYLTHRSPKAIINQASDLGIREVVEPVWCVPEHHYADEDHAFRGWSGPVSREPLRWRIAA